MSESAHCFAIVLSFVPICMYTIAGLIIVVWKDDGSKANGNSERDQANRLVRIILIVNGAAGLVYGLTLILAGVCNFSTRVISKLLLCITFLITAHTACTMFFSVYALECSYKNNSNLQEKTFYLLVASILMIMIWYFGVACFNECIIKNTPRNPNTNASAANSRTFSGTVSLNVEAAETSADDTLQNVSKQMITW